MTTQPPTEPSILAVDTTMSLCSLGDDILYLIFEQLNITDESHDVQDTSPTNSQMLLKKFPKLYYQQRKTLPILRLVCKTFNQAVLPVRFRAFKLKLTDVESEVARKVIGDILQWTRCVILYQAATTDWSLIERIYSDEKGVVLPRMETIKWMFNRALSNQYVASSITPIPYTFLRPETRISVSNRTEIEDFLPFLPPTHISHLNIGHWQPSSRSSIDYAKYTITPLKVFLLQAPNLKSFEYSATGGSGRAMIGSDATPFPTFKAGEKMPSLRVLTIPAYQWNHSADEVQSSWDFSHLTFLDIRGVPLFAFLSTVPFAAFSKLRILKVGDFFWSKKEKFRSDGILLLEKFLTGLPNLEELYLIGQNGALSLESFRLFPNLRILECREAILLAGEEEKTIYFTSDQLSQLREYCPYLQELVIDMDVVSTEFPTYLTALRNFPRLATVKLHTRLQSWDLALRDSSSNAALNTDATKRLRRKPNAHYTMLEEASNQLVQDLFQKLTICVGDWVDVTPTGGANGGGQGNKHWMVERVFVWPKLSRVG